MREICHPRRAGSPLLAGLALWALGCEPTTPDPNPPDPDCVAEVFAAQGCTDCHLEVSPAAGLDLASPELGARMIGAPAHTASCQDRLLIDPSRPERSLLLQAVGATNPPGGVEDACQLVMPPGRDGQADLELRACLTDWVYGVAAAQPPPAPFEPTPVEAAVGKVKALLDGSAPTAQEIAQVAADPGAMRALVERWTSPENPRFRDKLAGFLAIALQQKVPVLADDQFDRIQFDRSYSPRIRRVIEESFVRTALDIVERGAPFTEILTTRRWMMTTANLVYLRYADQGAAERRQQHMLATAIEGQDPPLEQQVAERTWAVPGYDPEVSRCARGIPAADLLDLFHGFLSQRCNGGRQLRFADAPLSEADFEDWRMVELVTAGGPDAIPFYDIPALRAVQGRMTVVLPRSGFFTTQAFFANWATNVDNQFRVTTNQTVLTALHAGFSQTEPTPRATPDDAAIPIDHVQNVETACYGCHKNMDPMRVYFAGTYNVRYQRQIGLAGTDLGAIYDPMPQAGFALLGHSALGADVTDLGRTLAEHPRFAIAWTQKVCLFANSARCDETDPLFVAIADRFRDDPDFHRLLIDVLSSPLVTGLEETATWGAEGPLVSITRRQHLCAMLDARVGVDGLCALPRVAPLIGLVPDDAFARGVADPVQPTLPSAFHYAAARTACEAIAPVAVRVDSPLFVPGNVDASLTLIVERLMGLTAGHPRHDTALAELRAHFDEAVADGLNQRDGARAAFVMACLSPDVMGVGL